MFKRRRIARSIISVVTCLFLLVGSGSVWAKSNNKKVTLADVPIIQQSPEHEQVAKRVGFYFTQSHFQQVPLTQSFSARVFDRYLKLLDSNKLFLTREDINQYRDYQTQFLMDMLNGKLEHAFELYNLLLKKRFERYEFALSQLDKPMDFTLKDSIDFKRDDVDWANSDDELNEYWIKRVKYDQLSLALSGKTDQEIKESLTKRYNRILNLTTQMKAEDGFQVMMNAIALEIDPHTAYLSPKEKRDFDSEMNLSFEGIGATLTQDDDYTKIVSFVKGGPAERSKLLTVGDRIIGVGQSTGEIEDVIGWRLDDIVELIKGKKGTKVRLEILPADNSKTKIIELTRDKIHFEDREAKLEVKEFPQGKVAIIEIPSFYLGLTANVEKLLNQINADPSIDGVIIDLRNNGGGSLGEVINLTGLFTPFGPVVQVKDNLQRVRQYVSSNKNNYLYQGPMLVLVNRYSASASEIFAAALQDYGRAIVLGETTYGKGTVQTSRDLNYPTDKTLHPDWKPLGGIRYTIEKFYRINGGSTQLKGVVPDFNMISLQYIDEVGERYLDNALKWDSIPRANYKKMNNYSSVIPYLKAQHEKRIKTNPEFNYILEDINEYNSKKDTIYILSLNKAEREAEQKRNDKKELDRVNERLERMNQPKIEKLDQLSKDYKAPDPYLDESINILFDFVNYR